MSTDVDTETEASAVAELREAISNVPEEKRKAILKVAFGYILESKLGLVWKIAGAAVIGAIGAVSAVLGLTSCTIDSHRAETLRHLQEMIITIEDTK